MRNTVAKGVVSGLRGRVGGRPKGLGLTIRGLTPDPKKLHSQFGNFVADHTKTKVVSHATYPAIATLHRSTPLRPSGVLSRSQLSSVSSVQKTPWLSLVRPRVPGRAGAPDHGHFPRKTNLSCKAHILLPLTPLFAGPRSSERQPDHDDKRKGHQRHHRAYSRAF